jgi:hypothetical protein
VSHPSLPNNKPFRPVWQVLLRQVFMDEIDFDTSLVDEKMRGLMNPYSIPLDISKKIITSIRDATLKAFESIDTLQSDRYRPTQKTEVSRTTTGAFFKSKEPALP